MTTQPTYRTFDRHSLFTADMLKAHRNLINDVELYHYVNNMKNFHFENMLNGIYDGYLYTDLLVVAMDYDQSIYERVLDTYKLIDEFIDYQEFLTAEMQMNDKILF